MEDPKRQGAALIGLLNDLKRNDEVAASELGVSVEEVRAWILGDREIPRNMLEKASRIWPVSERDFHLIEDDAPSGVVIMRAAESAKSERILSRGGAPYYAYRDTAMSRTAPFRPEWIAELVTVDGSDPDDPRVQWNNGHFMHQFTYFVGPVNFYFIEDGIRRVVGMNTGDTMYITPFVPHSFTTRRTRENTRGLILALTFGGKLLGDFQQELWVLGGERTGRMPIENVCGVGGCSALLGRSMRNAAISVPALAARLAVSEGRVTDWLSGAAAPSIDELRAAAAAMGMNVRDLLPYDRQEPAVVIRRVSETTGWPFGRYRVRELAGTSRVPDMRGLLVRVPSGAAEGTDLETSLFQYGYVLGEQPVTIAWRDGGKDLRETLMPDDSFVMKPGIPHRFSAVGTEGVLLLLRAGGRVSGDALLELSALGRSAVRRMVGENTQWYNPDGSRGI